MDKMSALPEGTRLFVKRHEIFDFMVIEIRGYSEEEYSKGKVSMVWLKIIASTHFDYEVGSEVLFNADYVHREFKPLKGIVKRLYG